MLEGTCVGCQKTVFKTERNTYRCNMSCGFEDLKVEKTRWSVQRSDVPPPAWVGTDAEVR